jgi:DNA modification methylase
MDESVAVASMTRTGLSCLAGLESSAPSFWHKSCANTENTLHQLSPYIGKLKSSISNYLLKEYTRPNDIVLDPFCGSGTIPLEATILNRATISADASPYAAVLTQGKLFPPINHDVAINRLEELLYVSRQITPPDLSIIPNWVRAFFHPITLQETVAFANVCKAEDEYFFLACLLGILHHQRPGFLSYPSSHLVPYLRDKKYPQQSFPQLYEYRQLADRIRAKVERAFRRNTHVLDSRLQREFYQSDIRNLPSIGLVDCIMTSPPYMNALDYHRDNRLRMWFLTGNDYNSFYSDKLTSGQSFLSSIESLCTIMGNSLKPGGCAILIIGEAVSRASSHPSSVINEIIMRKCTSLSLVEIIVDTIPDIRRARRECRGTKSEHILIYKRRYDA